MKNDNIKIISWLIDFPDTLTEAAVEFFDPKIKAELEKRDAEIIKKTGKGPAPGGDEWIWTTRNSRVPVGFIINLFKYYFAFKEFKIEKVES